MPLVLVAALAGAAAAQPGFAARQIDLHDASVWITNSFPGASGIGRFNVPINELTGGVRETADVFDVLQNETKVVRADSASASVLDPVAVELQAPLGLPTGAQTIMAGDRVAVFEPQSGRLWVRSFEQFQDLSTGNDPPNLTLGAGGAVAGGADGSIYGIGQDGGVTRLVPDGGGDPKAVELEPLTGLGGPAQQATVVGETPYGLAGNTVAWPGGAQDLSPSAEGWTLQAPGPEAKGVLVASGTGLVRVGPDGVEALVEGASGKPARPVLVAGCSHAAWAQSQDNYAVTCSGEAEVKTLAEVKSGAELVFRVNRELVVLNDVTDGSVWRVLTSTEITRPDWTAINDSRDEQEEPEQRDDPITESRQDCDAEAGAPTAEDDAYGIRPGATAIWTVVANDSTPGCGALAVDAVSGLKPEFGVATPVDEGRAIQFKAAAGASGTASFQYSVSDGVKAGVEATATVKVTIEDPSVNLAPSAIRDAELVLEQGASATLDVLQNFVDPESDPLTLAGAVADDQSLDVRTDPAGRVSVMALGAVGNHVVELTATDATSAATGSLRVSIRAAGSVTPQMAPIKVQTYVGQPATVKVSDAVLTGTVEQVALVAVPEVAGLDLAVDTENAQFTASSDVPGSFLINYSVAAGTKIGAGVARIEVRDFSTKALEPIAVLDVAHAAVGRETTILPTANDIAPTTAVKLLGEVGPAEGADLSGLKMAVVQHRYLQVIPIMPITAPITLNYTLVVDGQSVEGQLHLLGGDAGLGQPPTVRNVSATVRTGGVVSVPVLDHAVDPEGGRLTLSQELLCQGMNGQGLAFASGKLVRYQAPDTPGTVECVFTVIDPESNSASAALTIVVRESQGADKPPPNPVELTARAQAGQTVRIPVPLHGIDVDGDGVLLLGVATAPEKGRVTAVGADFIDYEALPGEEGTDTFTYAVEDWVGLRSTATIRVGVATLLDGSGLLARDDQVTLRPGVEVGVAVLANDVQSGNEDLTICGDPVSSDPSLQVRVETDRLTLTAPQLTGSYQIAYTACDAYGAAGGANLTLTVDPEAPLAPPEVQDSVVKPEDTRNKASVEVRVLDRVSNPSGPLSDLTVTLLGVSPEIASVAANGTITVNLQADRPFLAPFKVTNTSEGPDGPYAYGFLSAPRLGAFPPSFRPRAGEIEVRAGEPQEIDLDELVQVGPGKEPLLANPETITATKTDGSKLYRDDLKTLVYTARSDYAGPASLTFQVTDGRAADDPTGLRSTLTLLINVVGRDARPPEFRGAALQVAIGEPAATIDLTKLTRVPGVAEPNGLTFVQSTAEPKGFSVQLDGGQLSVGAAAGAKPGMTGVIGLRIGYLSTSVEGQVSVSVVNSRRPLLALPQIAPLKSKGEPVSVDVLAGAANPAPEIGPPQVLTGDDGPQVTPAGAGTASVNGSIVTVTPAADFTGNGRVSYTANDALGESSRAVRGAFEFVVIGRPDPPGQPRAIGAMFDGEVQLQWDQPRSRNSEIDHYLVEYDNGKQECAASPCTITNVPLGSRPVFTVRAHNEAGYSDPSTASLPVVVDVPPPQVAGVTANVTNAGAEIKWDSVSGRGSAVVGYTLMITGANGVETAQTGAETTRHVLHNLVNGQTYSVQIQARNGSPEPGPWSDRVEFVPYGPPSAAQVQLSHSGDLDRPLKLTWAQGDANGSTNVTTTVTLTEQGAASETVASDSADAGGSLTFAASPGVTYTATAQSSAPGQPGASVSDSMTMWAAPQVTLTQPTQTGPATPAAGAAKVQLAWEVDTLGQDASVAVSLSLGETAVFSSEAVSSARSLISDLRAGEYTVLIKACAPEQTGRGWNDGNGCMSDSTTISVVTEPAPPAVELERSSQDDPCLVRVTATVDDWGAAGGGSSQNWRYSTSAPQLSGTWHDLPVENPQPGQYSGSLELASACISARDVHVRACNSNGACSSDWTTASLPELAAEAPEPPTFGGSAVGGSAVGGLTGNGLITGPLIRAGVIKIGLVADSRTATARTRTNGAEW
ncbi:MAG: fibronectin type III domain-containing protein [Bifidobacteriaceae bacterium]|jgi:hypothetical protein|nr:fibronectin type III domain-containing protein [Bifidobacteriaceae bacterium]